MLAHCIHCTGNLGQNEALETFQVGKRLAFDPAKGRLWVVCPHCERWNLTPLEERWEAIEDAERQFRDSRLRAATGEIGLARLRSGLDLIRIGAPLRPEMAAWRYGDQFGRRRKRQLLITGTVMGSAAALIGGIAIAGASVGGFAGIYANGQIWDALIHGRGSTVVGKIRAPDGRVLTIQRRHARMSVLMQGGKTTDPLLLRLEHVEGSVVLHGADAERAAQQLLPTVNRFGGSRNDVQQAVRQLEDVGDPASVISRIQDRLGAGPTANRWKRGTSRWSAGAVAKIPGALHTLPLHDRLALEMALHEDSERRAMAGELSELERAWREAEEVANIADNLLLPESIEEKLGRMNREPRED